MFSLINIKWILFIMCSLGRTNSLTSVRHGDDLGFIRIWATPPNRLVVWDGAPVLTIGIRAMASKMTTTFMFEMEKFDEKSNILLLKMRVTSFLVKEDTHKALLGIEKKPSKMEDDE